MGITTDAGVSLYILPHGESAVLAQRHHVFPSSGHSYRIECLRIAILLERIGLSAHTIRAQLSPQFDINLEERALLVPSFYLSLKFYDLDLYENSPFEVIDVLYAMYFVEKIKVIEHRMLPS